METVKFQNIDLSYLNLMCDNDVKMRKTMLEMLMQELPDEVEKLKPLSEAQNWVELHAVSHKLKSTLSFVGNELIIEINKSLEDNTKTTKDIKEAISAINSITHMLPGIMEELRIAASIKI